MRQINRLSVYAFITVSLTSAALTVYAAEKDQLEAKFGDAGNGMLMLDILSDKDLGAPKLEMSGRTFEFYPPVANEEDDRTLYRVKESFKFSHSVTALLKSDALDQPVPVGIEVGRSPEGYQWFSVEVGRRVGPLVATQSVQQYGQGVGLPQQYGSIVNGQYGYGDPYLAEINRVRSQYGMRPIMPDPSLTQVSQVNNARGGRHAYAANSYQTWASYGSPSDVVNRWLNSPGHRAIILNPGISRGGCAAAGNGVTFSGR